MSLPILGSDILVVAGEFLRLGLLSTVSVEGEAQVQSGTVNNVIGMSVRCNAGAGAGDITYTLRVNGVNTSIVVTIPAIGTSGSFFVTASDVQINADDLISIQVAFVGVVVTGHTNVRATLFD